MRTIGYIGLGTMGAAMARRLADAGHELLVFDRAAAAMDALAAHDRVTAAPSAGAVAESAELVFACLPDPQAGRAALLGEVGVAAGARTGLVVCDHSTVDPTSAAELAAALAAHGATYLECPVLGGRAEAESGQLFGVVSGDEATYRRLAPLIGVVTREHRYVGGTGEASRFKSIQNGLGIVQWAGMVEALGILARAGVDLDVWYDVVVNGHGMADTPLFRTMARKIISGDPTFRAHLRIGAKDIALAARQARELGLDAPVFSAAEALFAEALEMGLGESDMAELARVIERRFGATIRAERP